MTPLRGPTAPGSSQRARTTRSTPSPSTWVTASRGVPSPITISERSSEIRSAKSSYSTRSAPSGTPLSAPTATRASSSPAATSRAATEEASRILGPLRSATRAMCRPAAAAASRAAAARARQSSGVPCEQLMRTPSMPASTSARMTSGGSVAGPRVARILVRRRGTPATLAERGGWREARPRYRNRMATSVSVGDLSRDPAQVARSLPAWRRGDPDEAAHQTLTASARDLHSRAYTCWAWAGRDGDGTPAWVLPVTAAQTAAHAPKGPALALVRCLSAAVEAGADPGAVSLDDWRGFTCLVLPGVDEEIAACALEEAHPPPARAALADLPPHVVIEGQPLRLDPLGPRDGEGLVALGRATRVHPVRVALVLLGRGQPLEVHDYPAEMVGALREWGCAGPPEPERAPSLAIEDDPCARRGHARKVLQRLLRMGKVGDQHHTEFDHLYRGAAPEDRRRALEVGEALLKAGLLGEKPSVGQRHVYLRRDRLAEIHALIERAETRDPDARARTGRRRPRPEGLRGRWRGRSP